MNKRRSVAAKKNDSPERERLSLLLPVELKAELLATAKRSRRSLNAQCEVFLSEAINEMSAASSMG